MSSAAALPDPDCGLHKGARVSGARSNSPTASSKAFCCARNIANIFPPKRPNKHGCTDGQVVKHVPRFSTRSSPGLFRDRSEPGRQPYVQSTGYGLLRPLHGFVGVVGSDVSRPRNAGRRLTQPSVGWADNDSSGSSQSLDAGEGIVQSGKSQIERSRALPCSTAL